MQENYELVQKGFRVLLSPLSGFIGQKMRTEYGKNWWEQVRYSLPNSYDLPLNGDYASLVDSLDIANCCNLISGQWKNVFKAEMSQNCYALVNELRTVRNIVSHIGQQDLDQPTAERALDTMALIAKEIDQDAEKEIRELYRIVRSRAIDQKPEKVTVYVGPEQPATESQRGELKEGSLLKLVDTDLVQRTSLSRKVTFGKKTVVYPVYRVRLDALFYNDQNDRISTWLSQYEAENGESSLVDLDKEIYNRVIEIFIYESNPESIQKTQKNMKIVGQREPGVTLSDGRIVDGNRRFTCLRRLQRESSTPIYFETVLMDMDIEADKKQIKLLELAVQHGEESKVDYDLIDFAVGTYRDIEKTHLLTIDEYAASTNEPIAEVKRRLDVTGIINDFLEYLHLPEQYYIARELQVYSLFQELLTPLRQVDDLYRGQLKKTAFANALLRAVPDQRKFIRDIKTLVRTGEYVFLFRDLQPVADAIEESYRLANAHNKEDIDRFAALHTDLAEKFQDSIERALQKTRMQQLKTKPADNVGKSISYLMEIDPRLFDLMDPNDKENFRANLEELVRIAESFRKRVTD